MTDLIEATPKMSWKSEFEEKGVVINKCLRYICFTLSNVSVELMDERV